MFVDVSNMTARDVQRLGHEDDEVLVSGEVYLELRGGAQIGRADDASALPDDVAWCTRG